MNATSSFDSGTGSIMIVVATDAPIDARNLKRLAARAMLGLGRTGSSGSNGSGDYVIAFSTARQQSTANGVGRSNSQNSSTSIELLQNEQMSPLFLAVIEATEEAIYNSLFRATTIRGRNHTIQAIPIVETTEVLR